jgi:NAD(P)-dependent dehydrogenase (short-subunit alcohol dehydrogenase family)
MASSPDSSAVWFGEHSNSMFPSVLYVDHNLVTGCSTGLGQAIASHVHNAGHRIVATARNINSLNYLPDGPHVLKLSLDVTSNDSVTSAIDATVKQFGRIDVVVNNAGYGSMGELEGFPEEDARLQLETNFWGAVNVTRASLRAFREVNAPGQGGTIVQVSSLGGYVAFEGSSFYHAS